MGVGPTGRGSGRGRGGVRGPETGAGVGGQGSETGLAGRRPRSQANQNGRGGEALNRIVKKKEFG